MAIVTGEDVPIPRSMEKRAMPMQGNADVIAYPCGEVPLHGELREISPGVRWITMPLPGPLARINLWLIEDGVGHTLVDTGLRSEDTVAIWDGLLSGALKRQPIQRIICTHMHPDHVGLAGWLARRCGCRLWMTQLEYLDCRVLVSDTGRDAPDEAIAFYRRAGWDERSIDNYRVRFGNFGKMTSRLPDSYRRLCDGETILIGDHAWEVVVGTGHTLEHACLYAASQKLFISGDQVLPRISSNVSVYPMEPEADPLGDWMASIDRLQQRIPDDVLVLPAHNEPFRGLHARLDQLRESHLRKLEKLQDALRTPRRVVDVFGVLFSRQAPLRGTTQLSLATGESLAHLNYLVTRQKARVDIDEEGVAWYSAL